MTTATAGQILSRLDPTSELIKVWRLEGGISAETHAIEFLDGQGAVDKRVIRQHRHSDRKAARRLASREYGLLRALQSSEIPVPVPRFLDARAGLLVTDFVEGTVALDPSLPQVREMARYLARVHKLDTGLVEPLKLPRRTCPSDELFRGLSDEDQKIISHLEPSSEICLLHGDFWPGNILWNDEKLIAILDWEDAALGDPVSDLAGCRLELIWKGGMSAVEAFTEEYSAHVSLPLERLSYWELVVASAAMTSMPKWRLPSEQEEKMMTLAKHFRDRAKASIL